VLLHIQERPETETRPGALVRILDMTAECVLSHTAFRRVLVALFSRSIEPGSSASHAGMEAVVSGGLGLQHEASLRAFVRNGGEVRGELYNPTARRGDCFLFVGQDISPTASLHLPSNRRYPLGSGWRATDSLVVPFWWEQRILGHIAVDDPVDGRLPGPGTLTWLEDLASVAALALRGASELRVLAERNRVLDVLTDGAIAGILLVDDGAIRYANQQACSILGYEMDELKAVLPWWQLIHPDDRPAFWQQRERSSSVADRVRVVRRDGRVVWLALNSHPFDFGRSGSGMVIQFYDETDHVQTELRLREQALHDPLTGLYNRAFFEEAIQKEIERAKRYKRPLSLMMADLSGFKLVNDRLGHQEGDRVLAGVAGVVRDVLRESDWVVRYGGDEFILVLPETGTGVEELERRLKSAVSAWSQRNFPSLSLGIDLGWASWTPEEPLEVDDLVRNADRMLYQQKALRNRPRREQVLSRTGQAS